MTDLPVKAFPFIYRGGKDHLKRETYEKNRQATKVTNYINRRLANENGVRRPDSNGAIYVIAFVDIAHSTDLDLDFVKKVLRRSADNGITCWVPDTDRHLLDDFVDPDYDRLIG